MMWKTLMLLKFRFIHQNDVSILIKHDEKLDTKQIELRKHV